MGLVVHASGRGDQDEAVDPLGRQVSHLQADRAAHRVPDEDGLVDVEAVEDRQRRLGQGGDVQDVLAALAAPVTGQVRNHVDPALGEGARGRHQVGPGDREPVEVDERDTASWVLRRQ